MVDFDKVADWTPSFSAAQTDNISESVITRLREASPNLIENALDKLFALTNREQVISTTLKWIRSTDILAYHGSRLTAAEADSVRVNGLVPLVAETRGVRLRRALSRHPRWHELATKLDSTITAQCEHRQGRVTLAFSRAALTTGYNHYLTHGSECDQCVAQHLLGQEGLNLLATDGKKTLIQVAARGTVALDAANPYSTPEEIIARGETPQLAREFLKAWSYCVAHPDRESQPLGISCDMALNHAVPAAWIQSIDTLSD